MQTKQEECNSPHKDFRTYSLPRAILLISSSTMASRVFGLMREMLMSSLFSLFITDAFIVAFRIPNVLRQLLGEGAVSVSIVPVLTEVEAKEGKESANRVICSLFTIGCLILGVVVVAGVLLAPSLVRLTAPGGGFSQIPEKYALTTTMLRFTFPYIFFIGLLSIAMGFLNYRKLFFTPAFSPVLFNVAMIVCMVVLGYWLGFSEASLVAGVLIGGVLQILSQLPALHHAGLKLAWSPRFRDERVKEVARLMLPSLFGVSAVQLSILVTTIYASYLKEGSVSYLFWADRLIQLPLGVIAVSAGTAILPLLSQFVVQNDREALTLKLRQGLNLLFFIALPASVGLFVLAEPIVHLLFERGNFDAQSTTETALAVRCYAVGLMPAAGIRIIAPAFYALKEMRITSFATVLSFLISAVSGYFLMTPLRHGGLALATSFASMFNFLLLLGIYFYKFAPKLRAKGLSIPLVKSLSGSAIMAVGLIWWLQHLPFTHHPGKFGELLLLFSHIGVGMLLYGLAAILLRCEEISMLRQLLFSRMRSS